MDTLTQLPFGVARLGATFNLETPYAAIGNNRKAYVKFFPCELTAYEMDAAAAQYFNGLLESDPSLGFIPVPESIIEAFTPEGRKIAKGVKFRKTGEGEVCAKAGDEADTRPSISMHTVFLGTDIEDGKEYGRWPERWVRYITLDIGGEITDEYRAFGQYTIMYDHKPEEGE